MIQWGLISKVDSEVLMKTLDLICNDIDGTINVTEIGLFNCDTSNGISDYVWESYKMRVNYTGIDNEKDKKIEAPEWMNLIIGESNEVHIQLENESQNLVFIDGCHCYNHVINDFFCYKDKVKIGAYIAFHDTGAHIDNLKDYQHGDKENPLNYIAVRYALKQIGLLGLPNGLAIDVEELSKLNLSYEEVIRVYNQTGILLGRAQKINGRKFPGWELIFDEADPENEAGGVTVFKRLF